MVLYVVTVSYVAFCCLILGWLLAINGSSVEALVEMGGTYGTLLTGVPVLIAVLVARQQLDAARKQHVATIKRSFRSELDALKTMRNLTSLGVSWNPEWFYKANQLLHADREHHEKKQKNFISKTNDIVNPDIVEAYISIRSKMMEFCDPINNGPPSYYDLCVRYESICSDMKDLDNKLDSYTTYLSQYWS